MVAITLRSGQTRGFRSRGPACCTPPATMGKNQQHKSMQMAKHSSRSGGGEAGEQDARYNGHDASFHTAEWHAARLAALQMERPRWGAGIWRPPPPAAAAGRPSVPLRNNAFKGSASAVSCCAVGTTGRRRRMRQPRGKQPWRRPWQTPRVSGGRRARSRGCNSLRLPLCF